MAHVIFKVRLGATKHSSLANLYLNYNGGSTKSHSCFIILILLLFLGQNLYSNYNQALSTIYFGRQASARSEAMGKGLDLIVYDPHGSVFNPANLAKLQGVSSSFSHASPYYVLEKAFYTNYYISASLGKFGSISLSRFDFNSGLKFIWTDETGNILSSIYYHETLYTLSYGRSLLKDLYIGININLAQIRANETNNAFPIDIGIIKHFNVMMSENFSYNISTGASVSNIFNSKIDLNTGISVGTEMYVLPVLMRVGFSNGINYNGTRIFDDLNFLSFIIHLEYQNLLNSSIRSGYRIGSELSISELLFLRFGFYEETLNEDNFPENEDYLNDITYGFGIQVPFENLGLKNVPVKLRFDYTQLEQPSYTRLVKEWDDFTVWNVSLFINFDIIKEK